VPIHPSDLQAALGDASASLQRVLSSIQNTVFPEPTSVMIETNQLSETYIKEKLDVVPAGHALAMADTDFIYVLRILDEDCSLIPSIDRAFRDARAAQESNEHEGKKDFCRVNGNVNESSTLYVGRSQKLRSRLKQHLSDGNKGTYAMHMLRWATSIQARIEIDFYQFDALDNLHVQALEEGLWTHFKPLFGRKGDK